MGAYIHSLSTWKAEAGGLWGTQVCRKEGYLKTGKMLESGKLELLEVKRSKNGFWKTSGRVWSCHLTSIVEPTQDVAVSYSILKTLI